MITSHERGDLDAILQDPSMMTRSSRTTYYLSTALQNSEDGRSVRGYKMSMSPTLHGWDRQYPTMTGTLWRSTSWMVFVYSLHCLEAGFSMAGSYNSLYLLVDREAIENSRGKLTDEILIVGI